MGKASKWLRAVLGLNKVERPLTSSSQQQQQPPTAPPKEKRRWNFVKSYREKDHHRKLTTATKTGILYGQEDPNNHAIAVAAATSAVAEAAVAAAHAAAEVVRLTSSGRCVNSNAAYVSGNLIRWRENLAAVKIQAVFRGYLARRALRALRSLVRLQAMVRGHIERKRTAESLRRMQALLRAQARARTGHVQICESPHSISKSSHFHYYGPPTPEKFEHVVRVKAGKYEQSPMFKVTDSKANGKAIGDEDKAHRLSFNWSERRMDERSWNQNMPLTRTGAMVDEKSSNKIVEIDNEKSHFTLKRRNLVHSTHRGSTSDQYSHSFTTSKDTTSHQTAPSPSSGEVHSSSPSKFYHEVEETFCTAENSPQLYNASSRGDSGMRSPFTPSRSDGSRSLLSCYSNYPNYMSCTESSRAKARSLSAPKQRTQYERSSSTKRYSITGFGELRSSSARRASALRANFATKAYPGSGRLDRLGMPIE